MDSADLDRKLDVLVAPMDSAQIEEPDLVRNFDVFLEELLFHLLLFALLALNYFALLYPLPYQYVYIKNLSKKRLL